MNTDGSEVELCLPLSGDTEEKIEAASVDINDFQFYVPADKVYLPQLLSRDMGLVFLS